MDFEEKRKRQLIRVVITEIFMVLAVAAIVVVSTLAAMGFMISGNGGIEQSGLMQLHTLPTGASVKIDGTTIFARTNLSRTLSAGEHSLEISRDNYDTWQKQINVRPGVLIRLYYPRLFLQNRVSEEVRTLTKETNLEFYAPSTNRNYILYAEDNAYEWKLLDVRGDEVKMTSLDLSAVLPGMVEEDKLSKSYQELKEHKYVFRGEIEEVCWTSNEENVLVKVNYENKITWVLVRLKDVTKSIDLTRTFGLSDGVDLQIIDSAATRIYALENRQLKRINTNDSVMSRVLLDNVLSYQSDGTNLVYIAEDRENKEQIIGVYRDDEKSGTILAKASTDAKVKVALASYYGDYYVAWLVDKELIIKYGKLPNYDENRMVKYDETGQVEIAELKDLFEEDVELEVLPEKLTVSPGGEFFVMQSGEKMMVVDLELNELHEYTAVAKDWGWFDDSMMYAIKDNAIIVWDFDGQNRRNLAESVDMLKDKLTKIVNDQVVVTSNNRWLYYLTNNLLNDENEITLTREKIRD